MSWKVSDPMSERVEFIGLYQSGQPVWVSQRSRHDSPQLVFCDRLGRNWDSHQECCDPEPPRLERRCSGF